MSYAKGIKSAKERGVFTIAAYIEAKERYHNYGGKIEGGEMFVEFCGKWMPLKEFNEKVKPPIVPTFLVNKENADKRNNWQH